MIQRVKRKSIQMQKLKRRYDRFWTVFSIKAFGNELDFYFAENLSNAARRKGVFCRTSFDSVAQSGEQCEKR